MGKPSLTEFYRPWIGRFSSEPEIASNLFDDHLAVADRDREAQLQILLEEAEETMRMLEGIRLEGRALLEIGGGVALVYAFLKSQGHDIVSIEPSTGGFGDRYRAGLRALEILGIDPAGWKPISTSELPELEGGFDLIFSHFVMEHILRVEECFRNMARVLRPGGIMRHRCPNYLVPFEPHYNIPLIPFAPKRTEILLRRLKGDPLWEELLFLTYPRVKTLCRENELDVRFDRGMLSWAFERLDRGGSYAARKRGFVAGGRLLKRTGLLRLLQILPPAISTPMTFTASKSA